MKEKFIELCKNSDLIVMGGITMQYFSESNQLSYRVLGEDNYFSLNEVEESSVSYRDGFWIIIKNNIVFKFKFYSEIKTEQN